MSEFLIKEALEPGFKVDMTSFPPILPQLEISPIFRPGKLRGGWRNHFAPVRANQWLVHRVGWPHPVV